MVPCLELVLILLAFQFPEQRQALPALVPLEPLDHRIKVDIRRVTRLLRREEVDPGKQHAARLNVVWLQRRPAGYFIHVPMRS